MSREEMYKINRNMSAGYYFQGVSLLSAFSQVEAMIPIKWRTSSKMQTCHSLQEMELLPYLFFLCLVYFLPNFYIFLSRCQCIKYSHLVYAILIFVSSALCRYYVYVFQHAWHIEIRTTWRHEAKPHLQVAQCIWLPNMYGWGWGWGHIHTRTGSKFPYVICIEGHIFAGLYIFGILQLNLCTHTLSKSCIGHASSPVLMTNMIATDKVGVSVYSRNFLDMKKNIN